MTVTFLDMLFPPTEIFFNLYAVPTTAHQCIPETPPANKIPHPNVFHHEFAQAALYTKNKKRAIVLAATAITPDPTT